MAFDNVFSNFVLSLILFQEVPALIPLVDLAGPYNLVVRVLDKLVPVRHPSSESWQGKHNCEVLGGDPNGFVNYPRVKVNVGIKFTGDEIIVGQSYFF